jgi:formate hydrogenlyase subunit 6/NADH:ubiquinone oxidoreductase subunit I
MLPELLRNFFRKPNTVKYPFERLTPPANLRGKIVWEANKCTGCNACTRDCPTNAIEVTQVEDGIRKFNITYKMFICIFCGQCVDSCPVDCIHWTNQFELAGEKDQMSILYTCSQDAIEAARRHAAEKDAAAAAQKSAESPKTESPAGS